MKRLALILGLVAVVCLTGCRKEKVCRCAVTNIDDRGVNGQVIRLITIDKGQCKDIRFVYYDRNGGLIEKDRDITDSVLCTDYHFQSDPDDWRDQ